MGRNPEQEASERCRLDRWLWASRFFKTRPLATDAVNGGKVHLNGLRVKPGRNLVVGDMLRIQKGVFTFEVEVIELANRRVSAKEAARFYRETQPSIDAREQLAMQRRVAEGGRPGGERRPDKHDRKRIVRFKRGE